LEVKIRAQTRERGKLLVKTRVRQHIAKLSPAKLRCRTRQCGLARRRLIKQCDTKRGKSKSDVASGVPQTVECVIKS